MIMSVTCLQVTPRIIESTPCHVIVMRCEPRDVERKVGDLLIREVVIVLLENECPNPLRTGHGLGISMRHLLVEEIILAAHQSPGKKSLGEELQVIDEPRVMNALAVIAAVHTIGHDIGDPPDELCSPHRVIAGLLILPCVHDMEGDITGLLIRQVNVQRIANERESTLPDLVFLAIEMLDLPEYTIRNNDTLLLALHGKMQVIRQHEIDMRGQMYAQRPLRVRDNVLRELEIDRRNGREQLHHRLRVWRSERYEYAVRGLTRYGLTGLPAVANSLPQENRLLSGVILNQHDAAIEHLLDLHDS